MFKELAPLLRQRAVLLILTHLEDDEIRVNVVPQKIKDSENTALTTPLTVTGTAEELDRDLPSTLVNFVGAHLGLKNTLDRVKEEMDLAAKAAQAEARSKSKAVGNKPAPKVEAPKPAQAPKPALQTTPEPTRAGSLFDGPPTAVATVADTDDEEETILAEAAEQDQFVGGDEVEDAA
jgi:PRTRC genetic system protein E